MEKNLDDFRNLMLSDKHIRKLVDYENFKDVFPGIILAGGACYFLWDRDNEGLCEVTNYDTKNAEIMLRSLNEFDTFIRQNPAVGIVRKISSGYSTFLNARVATRKPFGLPTNYVPQKEGIPCWFIRKIGLQYASPTDVDDRYGYLNKWKLLAPKCPLSGRTDFTKPLGIYSDRNIRISKPGECCTESWIVLGAFDTEDEVVSYKSYIFTKIVRFLLLQSVISQHVSKKNFHFVPDLREYSGIYTDKMLCEMWGISENEWAYIDSRITNI